MEYSQEFVEAAGNLLDLTLWRHGDNYAVSGALYTLGNGAVDLINLDFEELDCAHKDMVRVAELLTGGKALKRDYIIILQVATTRMLSALSKCRPYCSIWIERTLYGDVLNNYFGARLHDAHASYTEAEAHAVLRYCERLDLLYYDLMRTQMVLGDLLDNYLNAGEPLTQPYQRFMDEAYDPVSPKCYTALDGKSYEAREILDLLAPVTIQFGAPPEEFRLSGLCEVIDFHSVFDFARWDLLEALMNEITVKRCKHCGRFFSHGSGPAYEYCDNIAPGEEDRTCRMVGALRSHEAKIKNDPIWAVYRRAYKKYHARVTKKKMTQEEFLIWSDEAKRLRDEAIAGTISPDELGERLR